jgi:hypothetical protein
MIWVCVFTLPQASVACQVRVMAYPLPQSPGDCVWPWYVTVAGPQASVACGDGTPGMFAQVTVMLAGAFVKFGAVMSTTVIVWVAVTELPHSSCARQVRVSVYACGQAPGVLVWPRNVICT